MDNGEVIPGLNEEWTLGGAKIFEWIAGFCALIISSEVIFTDKMAKSMPMLIIIWIGSTFGLAALRRQFPDEERGMRNKFMVAFGFKPPGIPTPAALQPVWSATPVKELKQDSWFKRLDLEQVLEARRNEQEEIEK